MRAVLRDPIQILKEATSSITTLSIPGDLPELITGGTDGVIRSYDLRMGKLTEDLVGAPISSISPSPTSPKDTLLVSSLDGKLRIFDRSNGTVLQTFFGHKSGEVRSKAAWNYGEGAVLAGDEEGRIWAWNVLDVSWQPCGQIPTRAIRLRTIIDDLSGKAARHKTNELP